MMPPEAVGPVLGARCRIEEAAAAHRVLAAGGIAGQIVLDVPA